MKTIERYEHILNFFRELKPFKNENDIPDLPLVDKEDYENVIIPNLIRCGAIEKKELKKGATYLGNCRNTTYAIWNGNKFCYKRKKFGYEYDEMINHFQDDDGFDLFVPIKEII